MRKATIALNAIQRHLGILQVVVRALGSRHCAAGARVALIEFASLVQVQGLHEGCPTFLGNQGHGGLIDVDSTRQASVAACVVVDVVVALEKLCHHEVHEVHMPACGEGHDKPLQHRFICDRDLLVVVTVIDIEGREQQRLKRQGPTGEVPFMNRSSGQSLRQASNCRCKRRSKECQDCYIQHELPHEARADHAEDGETDIQVHQLRGKDEVEDHGKGGEAVVNLDQIALPFPVLAAVCQQLAADSKAVEHWLATQPR